MSGRLNLSVLALGLLTWMGSGFEVLSVHADGGSSSSGGGGGELRDPNVVPVGMGRLLMAGQAIGLKDRVRSFRETHPDAQLQRCPGSDLELASLPESFHDAFRLRVELTGTSSLSSGCGRSQGGSRGPRDLNFDEVCNDPRLALSYQSWAEALYELKSDLVIHHLIDRSVAMGGRIPITLSDRGLSDSDEFSWFDLQSGGVYWSPRREKNPFYQLVGRQDRDYVAHELTHVFLARALGSRYPRAQYWHDPKIAYQQLGDAVGMSVRTTQGSAFMESLANSMESRSGSHPFNDSTKRIHDSIALQEPIPDSSNQKREVCFEQLMGREKREPPLNNEAYDGWALWALMMVPQHANPMPYVSWNAGAEKKIRILDAIETHRAATPRELALALDQIEKSDEGRRWYQQFYWRNPRTGRREIRLEDFQGNEGCLPLTEVRERSLYYPLLRKQYLAESEKALTEFVQSYPFSKFRENVLATSKNFLERARQLRPALAPGIPAGISRWLLLFPALCTRGLQRSDDAHLLEIQAKLEEKGLPTGVNEIADLILESCPKSARPRKIQDVGTLWNCFLLRYAKVEEMAKRVSGAEPDLKQYREMVREWKTVDTRPDFDENMLRAMVLLATISS